jgi:hypothetical protein
MKGTTTFGAALAGLAAAAVAHYAGAQQPLPKRPWIGEACKQEFSTLCGELPPNSRRDEIIECLKKHPDSLSHECSEAIADRPEGARTPGPGRGAHHRGRRTGDGDSSGRGPFGGSDF